jgi:hypothetical protein
MKLSKNLFFERESILYLNFIILNSIFLIYSPNNLRYDFYAFVCFTFINLLIIYRISRVHKLSSAHNYIKKSLLLISLNFITFIFFYIYSQYYGANCEQLQQKYRCGCFHIMQKDFVKISKSYLEIELNQDICRNYVNQS